MIRLQRLVVQSFHRSQGSAIAFEMRFFMRIEGSRLSSELVGLTAVKWSVKPMLF
jgi:hypothetical protein